MQSEKGNPFATRNLRGKPRRPAARSANRRPISINVNMYKTQCHADSGVAGIPQIDCGSTKPELMSRLNRALISRDRFVQIQYHAAEGSPRRQSRGVNLLGVRPVADGDQLLRSLRIGRELL